MLKFIKKDFQKLNAFQLVNLVNNQVQFLFINLSPRNPKRSESQKIMDLSKVCRSKNVLKLAKEHCPDTQYPVVIVHPWPYFAYRAYEKLVKEGYSNAYVLEGGTFALDQFYQGENSQF